MAEKFEYTREWTDAEAFPLLGFTKSWENPEDYPTIELDETQVRKDMQSLHDEVKNYINDKLIPAVLAEDATEAARAAAEAQRETNENQRIENENARIAAEQARDTAESARSSAEQERAAAESARNTAEQAREAAEQARADETAGIVAQAAEQAVIASNAASEASSSSSGASTSASAAAASASSASESASASASSAAAAQASADEALSSKNSAKSEADRAKSEADRAAEIVGGDFVKASEKGAANGVATLGEDGKVPASQLPDISGADIPITSTPDADVTIWIDPDEDDQTESFYTKAETNTLLQNKADLGEDGKVPSSQIPEMGYSKSETLSDDTKSLFGLGSDAVPDDALAMIKTLIDNANSNVNSKARIQIVSYVGTGTNGSSNPNSLTFNFQPKIVIGICRYEAGYTYPFNSDSLANLNYDHLNVDLMTTTYQKGLGFGKINNDVSDKYPYGKRSSDGKTIYWYHNSGPHYQANISGNTYYYIAIG